MEAPSTPHQDHDVSAQDLFKTLLREQVAPRLRSWGFRGSGQNFELRDGKYWALIGFQRSRYSRSDELEFTVHAVAVSKDDWERRRETTPKLGKRPATSDHQHAGALRLDELDASARECWWTVRPGQPTDTVAAGVLDAVATVILPWLNGRLGRSQPPHLLDPDSSAVDESVEDAAESAAEDDLDNSSDLGDLLV